MSLITDTAGDTVDYCRICHRNPVEAQGVVCEPCRLNVYARARGDEVDEDHPAVREFDAEMAKYGLPPTYTPPPPKQGGCAVLAFTVAAVPVILAALGMVRLVA